eukprot:TRINITY_DN9244_c0_g1_i1.p1 TRINITY_DN9244_c0_g1~~TRINITY_DN9244_c0_g1_i1.p1  ORF type:complete len:467 (+),score=110.68 TRINITY_DN9244_c0_g1_i1:97-1497(+)
MASDAEKPSWFADVEAGEHQHMNGGQQTAGQPEPEEAPPHWRAVYTGNQDPPADAARPRLQCARRLLRRGALLLPVCILQAVLELAVLALWAQSVPTDAARHTLVGLLLLSSLILGVLLLLTEHGSVGTKEPLLGQSLETTSSEESASNCANNGCCGKPGVCPPRPLSAAACAWATSVKAAGLFTPDHEEPTWIPPGASLSDCFRFVLSHQLQLRTGGGEFTLSERQAALLDQHLDLLVTYAQKIVNTLQLTTQLFQEEGAPEASMAYLGKAFNRPDDCYADEADLGGLDEEVIDSSNLHAAGGTDKLSRGSNCGVSGAGLAEPTKASPKPQLKLRDDEILKIFRKAQQEAQSEADWRGIEGPRAALSAPGLPPPCGGTSGLSPGETGRLAEAQTPEAVKLGQGVQLLALATASPTPDFDEPSARSSAGREGLFCCRQMAPRPPPQPTAPPKPDFAPGGDMLGEWP